MKQCIILSLALILVLVTCGQKKKEIEPVKKEDTVVCIACKKPRLLISVDNNGLCFVCKQQGLTEEQQQLKRENRSRKQSTTRILNVLSSDMFSDHEIEQLIEDAKEIRALNKNKAGGNK